MDTGAFAVGDAWRISKGVLVEFVGSNRDAIIARTRARVASRTCPGSSDVERGQGIPVFLDQIGIALRRVTSSDVELDPERTGKSGGTHLDDRPRMGLTIAQFIHDYGEVCQAITEIAVERDMRISAEESRALDRCLDVAIAHAITQYSLERAGKIAAGGSS